MPFDGANRASTAQELLEAAMSAGGLRLIDPSILDDYKAEQVRRHSPSWIYRHRGGVQLAQAVALMAGLVSFITLFSSDRYAWGLGVAMLTFGLAVAPMLVPVRGPARWKIRVDVDFRTLPAEIRDAALRLQAQLPGVGFRLGELFQDRVNLDPYLIADYRGAQAVLGIWEGERVIACA
jgi:hypothetical protein